MRVSATPFASHKLPLRTYWLVPLKFVFTPPFSVSQ